MDYSEGEKAGRLAALREVRERVEKEKKYPVVPSEEDFVAAATPQPAPTGKGELVIQAVTDDLLARADFGLRKYGTFLRTNNGRDALMDAYQEALDLVMYLKQALMERR